MYFEKLRELYYKFNDSEIYYTKNVDSTFELLINICFAKCLQINRIVHNEVFNPHSFLFLSTLRGICEEIIVLNYIDKSFTPNDKDLVLEAMMKDTTLEELRQQQIFMEKYRPFQPVLKEEFGKHLRGIDISDVLRRNEIHGKLVPPTYKMAKEVNLTELYNFIYRGSCSFVHFNPRIMMRTVWTDNESNNNYYISITNFNKYYFSFSSFYGSYLFYLLFKKLNTYLTISTDNMQLLEELKEIIRNTTHFPDLVTFEEMNLQRPETTLTIINKHLMNQLFNDSE
jgi:hypothetical protein